MESDEVSQPLDDVGLLGARPADPPGASTVSDCAAAIVIPSKSAGRPQVEQNRAPSDRFAPQLVQVTAGFYPAFDAGPRTSSSAQATVVFALRPVYIGEPSQEWAVLIPAAIW